VLDMPDFTAKRAEDFTVHTTWITSDFTDHLASLDQAQPPPGAEVDTEEDATERVVVEVGGKRLEVVLPVGLGIRKRRAAHGAGRRPLRRTNNRGGSGATNGSLTSPMQGTIVNVAVGEGQTVAEGDLVVVLEAMKMEQPLRAHR